MARHVITIPINKSSNSPLEIVRGIRSDGSFVMLDIPAVSSNLYSAFKYNYGTFGMGLGWDSDLFPQGKNIESVKLYLYILDTDTSSGIFKYGNFSEGSGIPYRQPSDGAFSGLVRGWNAIDIGKPSVNSILLQGNLSWHYEYYDGDRKKIVDEYLTAYSHRSSNYKPYIEVTYTDIAPDNPTSLYPGNITLNSRDVIRFAWEHNSKEELQQKGFTLQYRVNNGSWVTVSRTTANQFYDMPANTLPTTGTVEWKVMTVDGNDEVSGYTSSTFTLGVVPQQPPIAVAPISQYIDENEPIKFEWNFQGGSPGETQSKFDLQYSTNGGSTWTTKTVSTSNKYYELSAGVLNTGNITWRVRTYNNWNEVSPWSENRSFTIIGSPSIPLIKNITNSGKPLISWQSQNQHLYELQILQNNIAIFDSGIIPSTSDKSFKLDNYLKDGNYKVKLRVFNEFNLSSPYAEKTFTISTIKPPNPIIRVFNGEYATTINVTNLSQINLVYRDNILIGKVKDNNFTDYTGQNGKEYEYFVRAINIEDNFADSGVELGKCKFSNNTLSTLENPENFVKLKYGFGEVPGKSNSFKNIGSLNYYDGREYPVAEYTEFKSLEKSLSFFVKTKEEVDSLIELVDKKKTLLFRDYNGENVKGVVFTVNFDKTLLGYNLSFTITKTEV